MLLVSNGVIWLLIQACSHIVQLELQNLFLVDMNQMGQVHWIMLRLTLTLLQMMVSYVCFLDSLTFTKPSGISARWKAFGYFALLMDTLAAVSSPIALR